MLAPLITVIYLYNSRHQNVNSFNFFLPFNFLIIFLSICVVRCAFSFGTKIEGMGNTNTAELHARKVGEINL